MELRQDLLDDGKGGFQVKPLCPFCSEPWADDMVTMFYDEERWGSDSMGDFTAVEWQLDISCKSCGKLIYRKEGSRTF